MRGVETDPAAAVTVTTYGACLSLTIAYVVSTMAYAARDRRGIWLAGAVLPASAALHPSRGPVPPPLTRREAPFRRSPPVERPPPP